MTWSALNTRVKSWIQPQRRLSITRLGRVFLLMTFGIGIGALNTGNNLLYLVLGLLLSLIIVSGILSERVIWRIEVRRQLPDHVTAHEAFSIRYVVSTTAAMSFAIRVKETDGRFLEDAFVPVVARGLPQLVRTTAVAPKRGPFRLSAVEVSTTYPFGLFEKKRRLALDDGLLSLPQRGLSCQLPDTEAELSEGDSKGRSVREGTGDFVSLKELFANEPAKGIAWRKSAAAGKLLKVERAPETKRQIRLQIEDSNLSPALERSCQELASLASRLLAQGHAVGLTTPTRTVAPQTGHHHALKLLEALAMVGYEQKP